MAPESLNDPSGATSVTRQVAGVVTVNGARLPPAAVNAFEVTSRIHFTADTFRVELALGGMPSTLGAAYWADSQGDQVALAVAIDGGNPARLILGQVDDIEMDEDEGRLTLTGRDLSAGLLDSKTAEKFQNQTAGEIAQILAARHGLQASVAPTTALAGTYYKNDHASLTSEQTEWDLLVYLAEREGVDVWVAGTTLHFEQAAFDESPPYVLRRQKSTDGTPDRSNATRIRCKRSQTLARDVIVIVRSYNQLDQATYTGRASAAQAKGQRRGGKAQTFVYNRANLTQEQVQKLAESLAVQITRHERVIDATLPGDNLLTTRTMVRLEGTETAFDQLYYPDEITRRFSAAGYQMELRAKNHSPLSEVVP